MNMSGYTAEPAETPTGETLAIVANTTMAYHVRVTYGDDYVRVFKVHAQSLEAAEEIARERVNEHLYIAASTPDTGEEDFNYDDELGDRRVVMLRVEAGEFHDDSLPRCDGWVAYAVMSDGEKVMPHNHPKPFPTRELAWTLAHRVRFDPENGMCWVAPWYETA